MMFPDSIPSMVVSVDINMKYKDYKLFSVLIDSITSFPKSLFSIIPGPYYPHPMLSRPLFSPLVRYQCKTYISHFSLQFEWDNEMYCLQLCPLRKFFFTTVLQSLSWVEWNATAIHFGLPPLYLMFSMWTRPTSFPPPQWIIGNMPQSSRWELKDRSWYKSNKWAENLSLIFLHLLKANLKCTTSMVWWIFTMLA